MNKYMTIKNKKTSIKLLIWLILFNIGDVLTTKYLLETGGQELNGILIWLSNIFNTTIINTVFWTHIGVLLVIIGISKYIGKKDKIEKSIYYMIIGTFLVYLIVIINNLIAIGLRLL